MKVGDLVSYLNRYYGIIVECGPYYEYGSDVPGAEVVWADTGFRSWEFVHLLEVVSEAMVSKPRDAMPQAPTR